MILAEEEIDAMVNVAVEGDKPSVRRRWAVKIRRMLSGLANFEFQPGRATSLAKLCEAGARYGWQEWAAANPNLLTHLSPRAKASLRRDLQYKLGQLTDPCLKLERTSFGLAMRAIGVSADSTDPKLAERMFLGEKPSHRLFSLFKKFPVLARLWRQVISQWREQATEVLSRLERDRASLARTFFAGKPLGTITNLRCSLSDSHNGGRTVMELQFGAGAIIYKPRPGDGEWEWGSLLDWMNAQGFPPRLRAGRVLRRKGYCWMERIEAAPCKNDASARRFYERMGGIIAAAYLVKAVDCHRDNLIASGEEPILVDADALWHTSRVPKAETPIDLLSRTGFFPNSHARSLQSRSSALGRTRIGKHVPRIGTRPLSVGQYEPQIVGGFRKGWLCLVGTKDRRKAFARRVRRIQSRKRRWIWWPTEKYAAVIRASIQPAALLSGTERNHLIATLCRRDSTTRGLIQTETDALKQLDIPYFVRSTKEPKSFGTGSVSTPVLSALRRALRPLA
jgi:hypothetical protein